MLMDESLKKNIAVKLFIHERLIERKHGRQTLTDVIEEALDESDLYRKAETIKYKGDRGWASVHYAESAADTFLFQ